MRSINCSQVRRFDLREVRKISFVTRKQNRFLIIAALAILILCAFAWLTVLRQRHGLLVVDAHVLYASGDAQPVAGEALYLLDADPIRLVLAKEGGGDPLREKLYREHPNLWMLAGVLDARRRHGSPLGAEVLTFMEQSRPLWETHIVQAVQTDSHGRAVFERLKPGAYWLMGRTATRVGVAFWNLHVSVKRGENKITLDQNNALECPSCATSPWAPASTSRF